MRKLFILIVLLFGAPVFVAAAVAEVKLPDGIISTTQAQKMNARGEIILLDIRQPMEWKETGLPKGAVPVTVHRRDFIEAVLKITKGDRTKPIALICATGGRSAMARKFLAGQGFTSVIDVSEGMLGNNYGPGWIRRGQPVMPYKSK